MQKDVSIIIPVKDEEENIPVLAGEVQAAMGNTKYNWECLWVDDGSTDSSLDRVKILRQATPRHRYVSLTRNFGQSAAMMVGFREARGSILVTLDGDGQNDPADIPRLVGRLIADKADMVNGRRKNRQDSPVRKMSSRIANAYRNIMTGESVSDVGCSLRAIRRECVAEIILFKGMHRFIPTLVRISGFSKIIEVPVNHRPRILGKTKYGIHNRLWVGIADTFAVRWMKSRLAFPRIKEKTE